VEHGLAIQNPGVQALKQGSGGFSGVRVFEHYILLNFEKFKSFPVFRGGNSVVFTVELIADMDSGIVYLHRYIQFGAEFIA
jgi:hypothetical protein